MSDAYPRDPRAWQSVQELIKCSAAFNISSDGIYLIRIRFPYESTYSQRQIPILMMATLRGRLKWSVCSFRKEPIQMRYGYALKPIYLAANVTPPFTRRLSCAILCQRLWV